MMTGHADPGPSKSLGVNKSGNCDPSPDVIICLTTLILYRINAQNVQKNLQNVWKSSPGEQRGKTPY
ncbi:hypothetical protein GDO81_021592 [Engystomops pustulosus]|uniref:Uncharacterized protein n=1 Tax=Engystomops pustulosus TaxID=76066 RepID=A0AAV6Z7K8_ENGPU|nr:hypothetical protein GDO81_021592 [Engystomops pustulosus]